MFAARLVWSWIGAFGLAAGAFCQTYVQFSLGEGKITQVFGINNQGAVVGDFSDVSHGPGFVRGPDGTITIFDAPGTASTQAVSINDEGTITGTYFLPGPGGLHAYVRDPEGNFTTFDPLGSINTMPQSIKAGGAILGIYNEANLVSHGFVHHADGKVISFDPPGCCINARGVITGTYIDANGGRYGFVLQPVGTLELFHVPESNYTVAVGINNAGAITGIVSYPSNG